MTTTTDQTTAGPEAPDRRKRMLTGDRPSGKLHLGHEARR